MSRSTVESFPSVLVLLLSQGLFLSLIEFRSSKTKSWDSWRLCFDINFSQTFDFVERLLKPWQHTAAVLVLGICQSALTWKALLRTVCTGSKGLLCLRCCCAHYDHEGMNGNDKKNYWSSFFINFSQSQIAEGYQKLIIDHWVYFELAI